MKSFTVQFHQEDQVDSMTVQKITEDDFNQLTEGGTRHLFELDTNIGFFVFFDAFDESGAQSHLVLQYEEDNKDPIGCYGFQKNDFYEFMALYLNDLEFQDEEESDEEEQEYGPIHHLAHLLFHIVEEGKEIEV
ncbi:cytosolic protein [Niallia sp. Krafla_26]|uniref:cytosolic protein n=1 Tax=Niallia sp. Krafla_26 TaxID=3064703 RepID=UPI003D185E2F